jgi:hypothetical protein
MPGFLLCVMILVLATPAVATDGVLEINQTCALETGCFPGDLPGLPITIDRDQPASYRLTSSLTNGDPNLSAIEIRDEHVTLDLNGFSINGPTTCSGSPLDCENSGSGSGITTDMERIGISVRNGVLRGNGGNGLSLGNDARVEGVLAVSNGASGIEVRQGSLVKDCRAVRNGASGIVIGAESVASQLVASDNGTTGITSFRGSSILDSASNRNGSFGITGTVGMTIRNNTVSLNKADGIFVEFSFDGASTITGNTVHANDGDGIETGNGATVLDNTIVSNGGVGLQLGLSAGYARNVLRNNTGGQVSGGIQIGTNLCGGDTTCP